MPTAKGYLEDERVIVEADDAGAQLQEKGDYGEIGYEGLELSLLEAGYLVEEDRLEVRDADSQAIVPVDKLLARGVADRAGFETTYLVYRDYRSRGFVVHERDADRFLDGYERGADPSHTKPSTLIAPRGEAEPGDPASLRDLVATADELGRKPLLAVVDEESDVTYYEVDHAHVTGEVDDPAPHVADEGEALLLRRRALLRQDSGLAEAGYGYEAGGQRFLSLPEAHHLAQHGLSVHGPDGEEKTAEDVEDRALEVAGEPALDAYEHLREQGLVPKTGFKYGVNYRIYDDEPGKSHAPYLVQALAEETSWTLRDVSKLVRLAHSVNKRPIVHSPDGGLMIEWTRP
jgi:tRNA-intron endonuclease